MARITVTLYATFREAAGRDSFDMEAEDLDGLLRELRGSSSTLDKAMDMAGGLVVLVNGRNAREERKAFADGDEVAVFPPVSGG